MDHLKLEVRDKPHKQQESCLPGSADQTMRMDFPRARLGHIGFLNCMEASSPFCVSLSPQKNCKGRMKGSIGRGDASTSALS